MLSRCFRKHKLARRKISSHAMRPAGFTSFRCFGNTLLNDDQIEIMHLAEQFAKEKMADHAAQWDADEYFPVDLLREAGDHGFGAIRVADKYGGSNMGRLEQAVIFESLSKACVSTTAYISIHNMVASLIEDFGSEDIKTQYLPKLATMESLASYCLTEPGSGSDAASITTSAVLDGDNYIINGEKVFISGAGSSDVYLIMAKTQEGITSFIVDKDTPGLSFGKKEKKLGWNSQPTRAVILNSCKVHKSKLLGVPGEGFSIAMKGLDGGRINIAACSLGGAQASLDYATEYVKVRKQFGKPLSANQNVQFKLADMSSNLHASRLMVRSAAIALEDNDPDSTVKVAMAKQFATDHCFDIVNYSLQMLGGYGYLKEYPIERYLRDLRVHQILEGTNEVMRLIISRNALK
eukprot:TRINITY_DN12388_c0_g1_i1.p1 TRINITY_DN12388_c0_g1~~TRINITY_DN12388_c0_g1_i1.p1  ORF type:complete len:407 (-),score=96.69 TRINITY_DN12388_c0_g1_i1:95-1315(-)